MDGAHPLFIKAQNCFENGEYSNAVTFYKKYLNINPASVKANYQLAVIYQEQSEYIQSIYYYEKYLTLDPNSSDKKIIQEWINSSKKQLFKELEKKYTSNEATEASTPNPDHEKELLKELNTLKTKNEKMRDFIIRHKDAIYAERVKNNVEKVSVKQKNATETANQINELQSYTVEPGDTLYGISKKVYGSVKYHKLLLRKNRKKLKDSVKLVPGDILTIPPKPSS